MTSKEHWVISVRKVQGDWNEICTCYNYDEVRGLLRALTEGREIAARAVRCGNLPEVEKPIRRDYDHPS